MNYTLRSVKQARKYGWIGASGLDWIEVDVTRTMQSIAATQRERGSIRRSTRYAQ